MKIKIVHYFSDTKFPYGFLDLENKSFITENVGNVFDGERVNMNYYRLANGMLVHIYNGFELPEHPEEKASPQAHAAIRAARNQHRWGNYATHRFLAKRKVWYRTFEIAKAVERRLGERQCA